MSNTPRSYFLLADPVHRLDPRCWFFYQRQTTVADFEQFPAPGQRVNMGGYSLHVYCTGEGSPTVIVDAGNGDFFLGWQGIQPEVAKFTRVCTYDRAGCEWSDPFPEPRTAKVMADGDGK